MPNGEIRVGIRYAEEQRRILAGKKVELAVIDALSALVLDIRDFYNQEVVKWHSDKGGGKKHKEKFELSLTTL